VLGLAISFRLPAMLMERLGGPTSWQFVPNGPVIAAAMTLTALTCVGFGLVPALHATRVSVSAVLKAGDSPLARSSSGSSLRGSFLSIQLAISLLLLASTGVVIRGVGRGRDQDLGFHWRGTSVITFTLPASYVPERRASFARQLMAESRAASRETIAFANDAPLVRSGVTRFHLPGEPANKERIESVVDVSSGFFGLLEIPIIAGRKLLPAEEDAVVVNEAMARTRWPGENARGKTLTDATGERRVVGVVKDVHLLRPDWV